MKDDAESLQLSAGCHAIVLAAGESRRMGQPKQLMPFGGRPLLAAVVESLASGLVDSITVVLGHRAEEVAAALDRSWPVPVHRVLNDNYGEGGMLSSIHTGLRALPPDARCAALALGDQPLIGTSVLQRLIEARVEAGCELVVPVYEGRRGHPILIGRCHFPAILALPLDGDGLRAYLRARPAEVHLAPVEERGVLVDVDTPDDYRMAILELQERGVKTSIR